MERWACKGRVDIGTVQGESVTECNSEMETWSLDGTWQGCLNTWLKVALWRWQNDEFDETVTSENEERRVENGQG